MSTDAFDHQVGDRRAKIERRLLARQASRSQRQIPPRDRTRPAPLSFGQERMWLFACLHPESTAGNFVIRYQLNGNLDVQALRQSLDTIQSRHEVLRTVIRGQRQVVLDPAPAELFIHDLREAPGTADAAAREAAAEPFVLDRRPPIRWHLLHLGDDRHELIMCLHHIASDGWSESLIDRELSALYSAYRRGEPDPLPPLAVQYADYAAWQRDKYGTGEPESLAWWEHALADAPTVLDLPVDRPASADASFDGGWLTRRIPRSLADRLGALCAEENATPFMGLLAVFAATISRLSGQDDLVIGAPVAGRQLPELEKLVGFFINTIALRVDTSREPGLRTLLRRVRSVTLGAYQRQDVPLDRVVERLALPRQAGRAPLVQVMFQVHNVPEYQIELPDLEVRRVQHLSAGGSALDLTVSAAADADEHGLEVIWEYRAALFDPATVGRLHDCTVSLLSQALADPETPLARMPLPAAWPPAAEPPAAATALPAADVPSLPVHQQVAMRAESHPMRTAITDKDGPVSYAKLNEQADSLAARLTASGVRPRDLVGICLGRSRYLVIAVVAVLKAGAAYLPIDPAHPRERVARIVGDAGPAIVLCDAASAPTLHGSTAPLLRADEPGPPGPAPARELPAPHPADLAYVIYTSGSTGLPKGVGISHGALASYLRQAAAAYDPDAALDWVLLSPLAFDFTVTPLFLPLLTGRAIVLVGETDPLDDLAALLNGSRRPPYAVKLTPAHLAALRERLPAAPVANEPALVVIGGDQLLATEVASWRRLAASARFINEYGPTEATVGCVIHEAGDDPFGHAAVPIGRAISGMRAYVLDAHLNPMPQGGTGELYLAGAGIARGYLGRPALTAERFVPDPFRGTGTVMYRTGDLVRQRPDGLLEFLGRTDRQVKIRGHRVEPAEVESALLACQGVTRAAVIRKQGPGESSLVAYVVADPASDPSALRAAVAAVLPAPLVPSAFVRLGELPLTSNGKIDTAALPDPGRESRDAGAILVPPATAEERVIAEIWRTALALDEVGAADDFFGLGGHSLVAATVAAQVGQALGTDPAVALRALFSAPTIAGMAAALGAAPRRWTGAGPVTSCRTGPLPLTEAQEGLWFVDRLNPGSCEYLVPMAWWLAGPVDEAALGKALAEVARRHEMLRTAFPEEDGRPVGRLLDPGAVRLTVVDSEDHREILLAQVSTPLDITAGPPLRALLARVGGNRRLLCLTVHHIATDGWSQAVLLNDLNTAYQAAVTGVPVSWRPLACSFTDYAAREREPRRRQERALALDHWAEVLRGIPPLDLPSDHPRPPRRSGRGAAITFEVAPALVAIMDELGRSQGVTPVMVLSAALFAFVHRWAGADDITIGISAGGRPDPATHDLIGFFVTMLAIRGDLSGDPDFTELLQRTRARALDAYAHQEPAFQQVVQRLGLPPDLSRTPVFQVSVEYEEAQARPARLGEVTMVPCPLPVTIAKYDLTLSFRRDGGRLDAELEFDTGLFETVTARLIADAFTSLLGEALRRPQARISTLPAQDGLGRKWPRPSVSPASGAPTATRARPLRTDTERAVARIWEEVLSVQGLGAEDDFFAHGGRSLLAVRAIALMRKSFGSAFPLDLLFKHSTVAAAAAEVERVVTEEISGMSEEKAAGLLLDPYE